MSGAARFAVAADFARLDDFRSFECPFGTGAVFEVWRAGRREHRRWLQVRLATNPVLRGLVDAVYAPGAPVKAAGAELDAGAVKDVQRELLGRLSAAELLSAQVHLEDAHTEEAERLLKRWTEMPGAGGEPVEYSKEAAAELLRLENIVPRDRLSGLPEVQALIDDEKAVPNDITVGWVYTHFILRAARDAENFRAERVEAARKN